MGFSPPLQTDRLYQIHEAVRQRAGQIASTHPGWPCRKGCDECCRRLAAPPRVTREEWRLIAAALDAMPEGIAGPVHRRIRDSAGTPRPVVCPLLDTGAGACLVYEARPIACRAYGFYAERHEVLGCGRIESVGLQFPDIVWGNHLALEDSLRSLGPAAELAEWHQQAYGTDTMFCEAKRRGAPRL